MNFYAIILIFISLGVTLESCSQPPKKRLSHASLRKSELAKYSQATFASGCFWHEEALFESVKGVKEAISGYSGGAGENPTYESIETGKTGYAETVNIYYDPAVISYATLLQIYFAGQDPTQVNGQGPDHGPQYRSVIFFRNAAERQLAEDYKKKLQLSGKYSKPIVAEIVPLTRFWEAEDYHQNYIYTHSGSGYIQMVSIPEIKKFQKLYPQLIKQDYRY